MARENTFAQRLRSGLALSLGRWICNRRTLVLRRFLLRRLVGMHMDRSATIYRGCEIRAPRHIEIGAHSIVGNGCLLDGRRGLRIGDNVNVSSGVWIWTLHHDVNSPDFGVVGAPVTIGDRAWLCSRSTLLPGVTIGDGAVVAAGAVVASDVQPYSIVGGVPAREIGTRSRELAYRLPPGLPFV